MRTNNLILAILLILIGGVIIGVSFILTQPVLSTGGSRPALRTFLPDRSLPPVTPNIVEPEGSNNPLISLEKSFEKGLTWLMAQQITKQDNPDGFGAWPGLEGKADVAFTALALVCVGQNTPAKYRAVYQSRIDQGAQYILKNQQANGSIIDPGKIPSFTTYKTSLSIIALAVIDKEKYQAAIKKAQDFLINAQYPESSEVQLQGGWGYQERGGEKKPNPNMSVMNQVLTALHASGLSEESETWGRAVEFLTKCQDLSETNTFRVTGNGGGFSYSPIESKAGKETLPDGRQVFKSYASMTYAGLLSFIYAQVKKDDPRVRASYGWIQSHYNLDENIGLRTDAKPQLGKQGLFYYYHTFAKALDAYGEKVIVTKPDDAEHVWAQDLTERLIALQKDDGTWVNEVDRWFEGYELTATSYSLMCLNICRKWLE